MHNKKLITTFVLPLFLFASSFAQNNNSFDKSIQQIDTSVKQIKSIFKKKDKTSSSTQASQSSDSTFDTNLKISKGGTVSKDAKVIEADYFFPFNCGAAVIKKGTTTALINKEGSIIVPFGKYDFDVSNETLGRPNYINGLFLLKERKGVVNYKGQFFPYPCYEGRQVSYSDFAELATDHYVNVQLLDKEGKIYKFKTPPDWPSMTGYTIFFSEGLAAVKDDKTQKYGYKNTKDIFVIPPIYDEAEVFSEERAVVGKKNEYGEMKYGFIDAKGNKIIDLIFSIKPHNFSSGRAMVFPKDMSEFKSAYINKSGQTVIKLTESVINANGSSALFTDFINGYAMQGPDTRMRVIDTTGKIFPINQFLGQFGIKSGYFGYRVYIKQPYRKDGIVPYVSPEFYYNKELQFAPAGFVDLKNKTQVSPAFYTLSDVDDQLYFDDVAGLAYAKVYLGYDEKNRQPKFREGYINKQGEFVIVKGETSKW